MTVESLSFSGEEEKEKEEIDASLVQNLFYGFALTLATASIGALQIFLVFRTLCTGEVDWSKVCQGHVNTKFLCTHNSFRSNRAGKQLL